MFFVIYDVMISFVKFFCFEGISVLRLDKVILIVVGFENL